MDQLPVKLQFSLHPEAADSLERLIMTTLTPFAHRRNRDASFDSICTKCFRTIASEDSEGKLFAREERHSCEQIYEVTRADFDSRRSTSARPTVNGLG